MSGAGAPARARVRAGEPPISVLFCADPGYVQHLAVAAVSLARSNPDCTLDVHLLARARDPAVEARLARSLAAFPNLSLTIHHVDAADLGRLPVARYWTPDVYLRYLAPDVLPASLERVLYLDCDLVVLDDIRPLWQTDLDGRALGAASDFPWDPDGSDAARRGALGIALDRPYVNSGVLLLDLGRWRRDAIAPRLFDFAERHACDLVFPDQDALNAVLGGDIHLLDCRWNLQARMIGLARKAFPDEFAATRHARRHPAILHYTTADKPWLFRSNAARKADYLRHLRLTDWADAAPATAGRLARLEHRLGRMLLTAGIDHVRVATRLASASARLSGRSRRAPRTGAAAGLRPDASEPPAISVIVNNYNYAAFLAEAVESALQQDHPSFEVIVVDDGSSDDSRARILGFSERVRAVFQENRGQAAAINAGVRASRGEILCFLDSDDRWNPDKLSRVAAAFAADPGAVLAYHRLQPARAGDVRPRRAIPRALCRGDIAPRLFRSAGWWPFPMTSAVAVRRSAWERAGDIPEAFRISADAWLVGIYPFLGRVAAIPDALGTYRLHDNAWSRETDDPAMTRRRMAHWAAVVDATNRYFEARGLPSRLDRADHLPLRVAAASLRGATLAERVRIALAGLAFAGEPNPLRRLRDTLRTARQLTGPGLQPVSMQHNQTDGRPQPNGQVAVGASSPPE